MGLLSVVFVVVCLHALLDGSTAIPFECRSPDLECKNGGSCSTTAGTCTCAANFEGYDCSLGTELSACQTKVCKNGGTCDSSTGAEVCLCPQAYSGDTCETKRIKVVCKHNGMDVTITPHSPFNGKIYIMKDNNALPPDCMLTKATEYNLLYNGVCGTFTTTTETEGEGLAAIEKEYYIVKFVQQYSIMQLTIIDRIITVKCEKTTSLEVDPLINSNEVTSKSLNTARQTEMESFQPKDGITIQLQDDQGAVISNGASIAFGDAIVAYIKQDIGGFSHFVVDSLTIAGGGKQVDIISNGCIWKNGKPLFISVTLDKSSAAATPPHQSVKITFKMLQFLNDDGSLATAATVTIKVTVCDDFDAACDRPACQSPSVLLNEVANKIGTKSTSKRRRRAVEEKSSKSGSLSVNLRILDAPNGIDAKLTQESMKSCKSIVFLVPVVTLALMLLVSMATSLYFCMKATRTWNKGNHIAKMG